MNRTLIIIIAMMMAAIVAIGAIGAATSCARAADRATLNACERMLSACYDACKAASSDTAEARNVCSAQCSTRMCGFAWSESFGRFQDRQIEEEASTGLHGLTAKGE
jgi:hypothetical protein